MSASIWSQHLNAYYMLMAVYGWYQWQRGVIVQMGIQLCYWQLNKHLLAIGLVLILSLLSGYLLTQNTERQNALY